jgi:hypothetical protein
MKHLGERVTALVDDQLSHDERDRALAHVARCELCQGDVELERQTKAALRRLPEVQPSPEFVRTLLALAEPGGPLPPERRPFPGAAAPSVGWRTRDRRPGGEAASRPVDISGSRRPQAAPRLIRRNSRVRLAAGGVLSAAALTMLLATLGAPAESGPAPATVVPPMEQFTVEHARSTGSLPFVEPAAVLVPVRVGSGEAP